MNFDKNNMKKFAKYAAIGLLSVFVLLAIVIPGLEVIGLKVGGFLLAYIEAHPGGSLIVATIIGVVAYVAYKTAQAPAPVPLKTMPKPTSQDYFKVLETVRPAVAEIASTLGLAPIDSHTDMAANGPERILQWGKVWGFKYKARKLSTTTNIDIEQARRIIQAQIATVLDRDNPSKLTETNFNYYGQLVPVIQVEEVRDDDAYIYLYIVMASETYFKQMEAQERASTLHTETDAHDKDF